MSPFQTLVFKSILQYKDILMYKFPDIWIYVSIAVYPYIANSLWNFLALSWDFFGDTYSCPDC